MKKIISVLVCLIMVLAFVPSAVAEDSSKSFDFVLSADGKDTKKVEKGDVITVVFNLQRNDSGGDYTMHAMQNEILYDSSFFELVEGSEMLKTGVEMMDIGLRDGNREIYMNFLSSSGGSSWKANTLVGSVQLRVIAESGTSIVSNENYLVSTPDGMDKFSSSAKNLKVIVSEQCTVSFVTNCDVQLEPVTKEWGEKISAPQISRPGYTLEGWYTDLDLKNRWDFENDSIEANMTLYAAWVEGEAEDAGAANGILWIVLLALLAVAVFVIFLLLKKKSKR